MSMKWSQVWHRLVFDGVQIALPMQGKWLEEQGFEPGTPSRLHAQDCRQYRNDFPNGAHERRLSVAAQGDHLVWERDVASWFDKIGRVAAYFEYGTNAPGHAAGDQPFGLEQQAWLVDPPPGVELGRGKTYVVRTAGDAERTVADMALQMKRRPAPPSAAALPGRPVRAPA